MNAVDPLGFARHFAALRSATTAVETFHLAEPAEDAPDGTHSAFEREADRAVRDERRARDAMVQFLIDQAQDAPVAVVATDGTVVAYDPDHADCLAVVAPGSVIRMG